MAVAFFLLGLRPPLASTARQGWVNRKTNYIAETVLRLRDSVVDIKEGHRSDIVTGYNTIFYAANNSLRVGQGREQWETIHL